MTALNPNTMEKECQSQFHNLSDTWTLWAHLPHDTDWSIKSYKRLLTFNTVEEAIAITKTVPEILTTNCMLFLMKDGIAPMWEDPKNKKGGCFSYKIPNKNVYPIWKELSYALVGNTISSQIPFLATVNGITISPKKHFCIIKIWTSGSSFQQPSIVTNEIKNFSSQGCLFKKHGEN
jgi:translation initiation factor 4E